MTVNMYDMLRYALRFFTQSSNAVNLSVHNILENVSLANALQLEAARRRAVPIRFNYVAVASLKSLSLSIAVLDRFTAYTLRYSVTLNFDPVTLTCDL